MTSGVYQHKKHTQNWKDNMSKIKQGKKNPKTSETLKRLYREGKLKSILRGKKRPELSGENHWCWKGGITPENFRIRSSLEFELWRKSVFLRDNFTCQKCGQIGGKLHTHHINNFAEFPDLRLAIDNGITLCREHHKEFHRKYGIKHNTKEQLDEFIKTIG